MLTCYGHECRLPHGHLAYLAFRCAALHNLDLSQQSIDGEEPEGSAGYLSFVPMLADIGVLVQIDLLAEVWAKHRTDKLIEADLLDAAVVYAACRTAGRLIRKQPEIVRLYEREGPCRLQLSKVTSEKFRRLFESFWDDYDFLLVGEWQDDSADKRETMNAIARIPDTECLFNAISRGRVSRTMATNLEGLLTADEIQQCVEEQNKK